MIAGVRDFLTNPLHIFTDMLSKSHLYLLLATLMCLQHSVSRAQTPFEKNTTISTQACEPVKGRSLSIVVPFRAGGGFDIDVRTLKPFLQRHSMLEVSVVNMPGAGGMLAARTVADSQPNKQLVGMFDPRSMAVAQFEGYQGIDLSKFIVLGSMGATRGIWVSTRALDWENLQNKRLVAASGSESLTRLLLPSKAMGLDVIPIKGLQSSTEAFTALLRGEIDFVVAGSDTAERWIKTSPQAKAALVLASSPDPSFPGAPYLSGPGGMAERLAKSESKNAKENRMALATQVSILSDTNRMLLASAQSPSAMRRCLEAAFATAMIDPEYLNTSTVKSSNKEALTLAQAQLIVNQIQAAVERNKELLTSLSQPEATPRQSKP